MGKATIRNTRETPRQLAERLLSFWRPWIYNIHWVSIFLQSIRKARRNERAKRNKRSIKPHVCVSVPCHATWWHILLYSRVYIVRPLYMDGRIYTFNQYVTLCFPPVFFLYLIYGIMRRARLIWTHVHVCSLIASGHRWRVCEYVLYGCTEPERRTLDVCHSIWPSSQIPVTTNLVSGLAKSEFPVKSTPPAAAMHFIYMEGATSITGCCSNGNGVMIVVMMILYLRYATRTSCTTLSMHVSGKWEQSGAALLSAKHDCDANEIFFCKVAAVPVRHFTFYVQAFLLNSAAKQILNSYFIPKQKTEIFENDKSN